MRIDVFSYNSDDQNFTVEVHGSKLKKFSVEDTEHSIAKIVEQAVSQAKKEGQEIQKLVIGSDLKHYKVLASSGSKVTKVFQKTVQEASLERPGSHSLQAMLSTDKKQEEQLLNTSVARSVLHRSFEPVTKMEVIYKKLLQFQRWVFRSDKQLHHSVGSFDFLHYLVSDSAMQSTLQKTPLNQAMLMKALIRFVDESETEIVNSDDRPHLKQAGIWADQIQSLSQQSNKKIIKNYGKIARAMEKKALKLKAEESMIIPFSCYLHSEKNQSMALIRCSCKNGDYELSMMGSDTPFATLTKDQLQEEQIFERFVAVQLPVIYQEKKGQGEDSDLLKRSELATSNPHAYVAKHGEGMKEKEGAVFQGLLARAKKSGRLGDEMCAEKSDLADTSIAAILSEIVLRDIKNTFDPSQPFATYSSIVDASLKGKDRAQIEAKSLLRFFYIYQEKIDQDPQMRLLLSDAVDRVIRMNQVQKIEDPQLQKMLLVMQARVKMSGQQKEQKPLSLEKNLGKAKITEPLQLAAKGASTAKKVKKLKPVALPSPLRVKAFDQQKADQIRLPEVEVALSVARADAKTKEATKKMHYLERARFRILSAMISTHTEGMKQALAFEQTEKRENEQYLDKDHVIVDALVQEHKELAQLSEEERSLQKIVIAIPKIFTEEPFLEQKDALEQLQQEIRECTPGNFIKKEKEFYQRRREIFEGAIEKQEKVLAQKKENLLLKVKEEVDQDCVKKHFLEHLNLQTDTMLDKLGLENWLLNARILTEKSFREIAKSPQFSPFDKEGNPSSKEQIQHFIEKGKNTGDYEQRSQIYQKLLNAQEFLQKRREEMQKQLQGATNEEIPGIIASYKTAITDCICETRKEYSPLARKEEIEEEIEENIRDRIEESLQPAQELLRTLYLIADKEEHPEALLNQLMFQGLGQAIGALEQIRDYQTLSKEIYDLRETQEQPLIDHHPVFAARKRILQVLKEQLFIIHREIDELEEQEIVNGAELQELLDAVEIYSEKIELGINCLLENKNFSERSLKRSAKTLISRIHSLYDRWQDCRQEVNQESFFSEKDNEELQRKIEDKLPHFLEDLGDRPIEETQAVYEQIFSLLPIDNLGYNSNRQVVYRDNNLDSTSCYFGNVVDMYKRKFRALADGLQGQYQEPKMVLYQGIAKAMNYRGDHFTYGNTKGAYLQNSIQFSGEYLRQDQLSLADPIQRRQARVFLEFLDHMEESIPVAKREGKQVSFSEQTWGVYRKRYRFSPIHAVDPKVAPFLERYLRADTGEGHERSIRLQRVAEKNGMSPELQYRLEATNSAQPDVGLQEFMLLCTEQQMLVAMNQEEKDLHLKLRAVIENRMFRPGHMAKLAADPQKRKEILSRLDDAIEKSKNNSPHACQTLIRMKVAFLLEMRSSQRGEKESCEENIAAYNQRTESVHTAIQELFVLSRQWGSARKDAEKLAFSLAAEEHQAREWQGTEPNQDLATLFLSWATFSKEFEKDWGENVSEPADGVHFMQHVVSNQTYWQGDPRDYPRMQMKGSPAWRLFSQEVLPQFQVMDESAKKDFFRVIAQKSGIPVNALTNEMITIEEGRIFAKVQGVEYCFDPIRGQIFAEGREVQGGIGVAESILDQCPLYREGMTIEHSRIIQSRDQEEVIQEFTIRELPGKTVRVQTKGEKIDFSVGMQGKKEKMEWFTYRQIEERVIGKSGNGGSEQIKEMAGVLEEFVAKEDPATVCLPKPLKQSGVWQKQDHPQKGIFFDERGGVIAETNMQIDLQKGVRFVRIVQPGSKNILVNQKGSDLYQKLAGLAGSENVLIWADPKGKVQEVELLSPQLHFVRDPVGGGLVCQEISGYQIAEDQGLPKKDFHPDWNQYLVLENKETGQAMMVMGTGLVTQQQTVTKKGVKQLFSSNYAKKFVSVTMQPHPERGWVFLAESPEDSIQLALSSMAVRNFSGCARYLRAAKTSDALDEQGMKALKNVFLFDQSAAMQEKMKELHPANQAILLHAMLDTKEQDFAAHIASIRLIALASAFEQQGEVQEFVSKKQVIQWIEQAFGTRQGEKERIIPYDCRMNVQEWEKIKENMDFSDDEIQQVSCYLAKMICPTLPAVVTETKAAERNVNNRKAEVDVVEVASLLAGVRQTSKKESAMSMHWGDYLEQHFDQLLQVIDQDKKGPISLQKKLEKLQDSHVVRRDLILTLQKAIRWKEENPSKSLLLTIQEKQIEIFSTKLDNQVEKIKYNISSNKEEEIQRLLKDLKSFQWKGRESLAEDRKAYYGIIKKLQSIAKGECQDVLIQSKLVGLFTSSDPLDSDGINAFKAKVKIFCRELEAVKQQVAVKVPKRKGLVKGKQIPEEYMQGFVQAIRDVLEHIQLDEEANIEAPLDLNPEEEKDWIEEGKRKIGERIEVVEDLPESLLFAIGHLQGEVLDEQIAQLVQNQRVFAEPLSVIKRVRNLEERIKARDLLEDAQLVSVKLEDHPEALVDEKSLEEKHLVFLSKKKKPDCAAQQQLLQGLQERAHQQQIHLKNLRLQVFQLVNQAGEGQDISDISREKEVISVEQIFISYAKNGCKDLNLEEKDRKKLLSLITEHHKESPKLVGCKRRVKAITSLISLQSRLAILAKSKASCPLAEKVNEAMKSSDELSELIITLQTEDLEDSLKKSPYTKEELIEDLRSCRKQMQDFASVNAIKRQYETDPEHDQVRKLLAFEHELGIVFRKGQIEELQSRSIENTLLSFLGTGSGKTTMGPAMLAMLANGRNMVCQLDTKERMPALVRTRDQGSRQIYGRKTYQFHFTRDQDRSIDELQKMYLELLMCIEGEQTVHLSKESLGCLWLQLITWQNIHKENPSMEIESKIAITQKMIQLFRERGVGVADEVHQILDITEALDYAEGKEKSLKEYKDYYEAITDLFTTMYSGGEEKTEAASLLKIQENQQTLVEQEQVNQGARSLAKSIIDRAISAELSEDDTPAFAAIRKVLQTIEKEKLAEFLASREEMEEDQQWQQAIGSLSLPEKKSLGAVKEVLSRTIHKVVKLRGGERYAVNHENGLSVCPARLGKAQPKKESDDIFQTIFVHYMYYIQNGFPEEGLFSLLSNWGQQMEAECEEGAVRKHTVVYQKMLKVFGDPVPKIDTEEAVRKAVDELQERARKNPKILCTFLEQIVFPKMHVFPKKISADTMDLSWLLGSIGGFAATIGSQSSMTKDLTKKENVQVRLDAMDNFRQVHHNKENQQQFVLDDVKPGKTSLQEQFKSAGIPITDYRAIVDIGGLFQDRTPLQLAKEIRDIFSDSLEGVLVYNDQDELMILRPGANQLEPFAEKQTPPAFNKRFTVYRQSQITGADIPQGMKAKALITVNELTTWEDYQQGVGRLRGMKTGQTFSVCYRRSLQEKNEKVVIDELDKDSIIKSLAKLEGFYPGNIQEKYNLQKEIDQLQWQLAVIQGKQEGRVTSDTVLDVRLLTETTEDHRQKLKVFYAKIAEMESYLTAAVATGLCSEDWQKIRKDFEDQLFTDSIKNPDQLLVLSKTADPLQVFEKTKARLLLYIDTKRASGHYSQEVDLALKDARQKIKGYETPTPQELPKSVASTKMSREVTVNKASNRNVAKNKQMDVQVVKSKRRVQAGISGKVEADWKKWRAHNMQGLFTTGVEGIQAVDEQMFAHLGKQQLSQELMQHLFGDLFVTDNVVRVSKIGREERRELGVAGQKSIQSVAELNFSGKTKHLLLDVKDRAVFERGLSEVRAVLTEKTREKLSSLDPKETIQPRIFRIKEKIDENKNVEFFDFLKDYDFSKEKFKNDYPEYYSEEKFAALDPLLQDEQYRSKEDAMKQVASFLDLKMSEEEQSCFLTSFTKEKYTNKEFISEVIKFYNSPGEVLLQITGLEKKDRQVLQEFFGEQATIAQILSFSCQVFTSGSNMVCVGGDIPDQGVAEQQRACKKLLCGEVSYTKREKIALLSAIFSKFGKDPADFYDAETDEWDFSSLTQEEKSEYQDLFQEILTFYRAVLNPNGEEGKPVDAVGTGVGDLLLPALYWISVC